MLNSVSHHDKETAAAMTQNVQYQDAGAHVTSFCGSSSFCGGHSSS